MLNLNQNGPLKQLDLTGFKFSVAVYTPNVFLLGLHAPKQ